jgi:hypothetical protein
LHDSKGKLQSELGKLQDLIGKIRGRKRVATGIWNGGTWIAVAPVAQDFAPSTFQGSQAFIHIEASGVTVDLTIWLPAMFLMGLASFALLFACVPGCDNV